MFGWKWRTIQRMGREIAALELELAAERKITDSLQKALVVAADPSRAYEDAVEEAIAVAATDYDAPVVQAPDGEYIAPGSYDFERLAHEMWDNETGGSSGAW